MIAQRPCQKSCLSRSHNSTPRPHSHSFSLSRQLSLTTKHQATHQFKTKQNRLCPSLHYIIWLNQGMDLCIVHPSVRPALHTSVLLVIAVKRDLGCLGLDVHVLEVCAVHLALLLLDRSAELEQLLGHLQAQPEKAFVNNCSPSFLCCSALTLSQSSSFATGYGGSRGYGYRLPFFNPSPGALFFPTSRDSTLTRKESATSIHNAPLPCRWSPFSHYPLVMPYGLRGTLVSTVAIQPLKLCHRKPLLSRLPPRPIPPCPASPRPTISPPPPQASARRAHRLVCLPQHVDELTGARLVHVGAKEGMRDT